jgi:hypothetical protein
MYGKIFAALACSQQGRTHRPTEHTSGVEKSEKWIEKSGFLHNATRLRIVNAAHKRTSTVGYRIEEIETIYSIRPRRPPK